MDSIRSRTEYIFSSEDRVGREGRVRDDEQNKRDSPGYLPRVGSNEEGRPSQSPTSPDGDDHIRSGIVRADRPDEKETIAHTSPEVESGECTTLTAHAKSPRMDTSWLPRPMTWRTDVDTDQGDHHTRGKIQLGRTRIKRFIRPRLAVPPRPGMAGANQPKAQDTVRDPRGERRPTTWENDWFKHRSS